MPILDEEPKWILKSKAFIGVFIMLITVIVGDSNFVDVPILSNFLTGLVQDGAFSLGALLSIFGTAVRTHQIVLWPSKAE